MGKNYYAENPKFVSLKNDLEKKLIEAKNRQEQYNSLPAGKDKDEAGKKLEAAKKEYNEVREKLYDFTGTDKDAKKIIFDIIQKVTNPAPGKQVYPDTPTFSDPATIAPVDVQEVKDKDKKTVTEKDRDNVVDRSMKQADVIRDNYTADTMLDTLNKHRNNNHAKNNIRGNLNGKVYGDTLAASRAADELNNTRWWMPGRGALITRFLPSIQGEIGYGKRFEPIETQEMRQMRANERIDENARMLDNQFAYEVNKLPLEAQRQFVQMSTSLAQVIGTTDVAVQQALRLAIINNDYNLPTQTRYQQMFHSYVQYLQYSVKSKVAKEVFTFMNTNPDVGNALAQALLGTMSLPSVEQTIWSNFVTSELSKVSGDEAKIKRLLELQQENALSVIKSTTGTFYYAAGGAR